MIPYISSNFNSEILFWYQVVSPSGYTKSVLAESKWHAIDIVRKMELQNCPTIDGQFAYGVNLYTVKRIN
jgi:hypothetical protein